MQTFTPSLIVAGKITSIKDSNIEVFLKFNNSLGTFLGRSAIERIYFIRPFSSYREVILDIFRTPSMHFPFARGEDVRLSTPNQHLQSGYSHTLPISIDIQENRCPQDPDRNAFRLKPEAVFLYIFLILGFIFCLLFLSPPRVFICYQLI